MINIGDKTFKYETKGSWDGKPSYTWVGEPCKRFEAIAEQVAEEAKSAGYEVVEYDWDNKQGLYPCPVVRIRIPGDKS